MTAFEGEALSYQVALVADAEATDGVRLSYTDATAHDWMFGVLWHRQGLSRAGRPLWKLVNTARQRRCMLRLLCQVCGRSALDGGRIWWLLPEPPGVTAGGRPFTHAPPTCRSCIPAARMWCPRLGSESYVYTVAAVSRMGWWLMCTDLPPGGRWARFGVRWRCRWRRSGCWSTQWPRNYSSGCMAYNGPNWRMG
ncbi:hypothetical protein [Nonomuraea wenchangensis]|uniref:hypothetical protein n=1 Tax=Nonomuraea wenchangensis TaxID=568860 RepID=UPI00333065A9